MWIPGARPGMTTAARRRSFSSQIERDDFSSNRHPALSFCLSMISAQTLRVCREGKPVPTFPDHALTERYADALFLAPDNVAMLAYLAGPDVQRDLVGNGQGAHNLEGGSGGGDVADGAIDSDAVELNRSGLEYAFPRLCTSLIHPHCFERKSLRVG